MEEMETTEATEQEQPEVSSEATEPMVNQEPTQAEQEILDWTQDKRSKSMWKNDPNELYRSYKNMEKMHAPLKSQSDQLNNVFKQYGVESGKIGDVLKEYQTYKDPNAPSNQWLNYLSTHLSHPENKEEVVKFFNDLDARMDRQKYGENLPPQVIEQLKKAEQLEARLNEKEQSEQQQKAMQETVKVIDAKLNEVEQLAKEFDVIYDEQTKNELLAYCNENDVDPRYIPDVFARFALSASKQSAAVKAQRAVVSNMQSNKKAGITTKSVSAPKSFKTSFRDAAAKALGFE